MAIKGLFYLEALVSDFARSKQFYQDTLGWELNTDLPEVAGFYFGEGYLVLVVDQRPEGERRYGGGMRVEVQVDDLDARHRRLKDLGVAVGDIDAKPWGERKFTFADPDGYQWAYGQPA